MKFKNICRKNICRVETVVVVLACIVFGLVFYITGCSDVSFSGITSFNCAEETGVEGVSCSDPLAPAEFGDDPGGSPGGPGGPGGGLNGAHNPTDGEFPGDGDSFNKRSATRRAYTPATVINTHLGRINILFVVDYSRSMKQELKSIADQFESFLSDIKKADYQIAIITTNWIEDRGQFVEFSNGEIFLSNSDRSNRVHRGNIRLFKEAIERDVSEDFSDERGIYALNMALDNSAHASFFRPHSLLLVVIISDEDERSYGGQLPEGHYDIHNRLLPLEDYDYPETFFRKVSQQQKFSTVAVHSIIVKPKDQSCATQSGGIPGRIYAQASKPSRSILSRYGNIKRGHIGSICSRDYSSQLGPIAHKLGEVPPIPLPCFPIQNTVRVKIDDERVRFNLDGRTIAITEEVSFGDRAKIFFRCSQSASTPL